MKGWGGKAKGVKVTFQSFVLKIAMEGGLSNLNRQLIPQESVG